jgi:hypothetical protein
MRAAHRIGGPFGNISWLFALARIVHCADFPSILSRWQCEASGFPVAVNRCTFVYDALYASLQEQFG